MRQRLVALDDLVDEHLAFARKSTAREYAESIGVAVLIALFLRAFVVEAALDTLEAGQDGPRQWAMETLRRMREKGRGEPPPSAREARLTEAAQKDASGHLVYPPLQQELRL